MSTTNNTRRAAKFSFGFDTFMRDPDYSRFQNWYDRKSFFATPRKQEIETLFSEPEMRRAA
jgi:hypothetical protein